MNEGKGVIEKSKGPCVILAGAGTGKTHTIVEKVKHLISRRIYEPEKVVCITFSNEAANNILSRIRENIDFSESNEPIVKTFHAFSADLLRKHGEKLGIPEDFGILTPEESKVVLHRNLRITPYYCHRYISSIGMAKDLGIALSDLEEYLNKKILGFPSLDLEKKLESLEFELQTLHLGKDRFKKRELFSEIKKIRDLINLKKFVNAWGAYEKLKAKKNYQDYPDLNTKALELLKKFPEVKEDFEYIIVDEFQDTNKVQLDLLFQLVKDRNISVVGDLNQSIYRFRGAYKENLSEFKNFFGISNSEVFNLDRSYRSSNKILRIAHKLILNNYENPEDCFLVENFKDREGDKIEVYEMKNAKEEARKVSEIVKQVIEGGKMPGDICVMFRTHQQGRVIRNYFDFLGIPYSAVSKQSLLKHKTVKTVVDYLVILDKLKRKNSGGEQVWWDLVYQLDFAEEDLRKIGRFIKDNRESENLSAVMLSSLEDLGLSESGRLSSRILIERIKRLIPSMDKNVCGILEDLYAVMGFLDGKDSKELTLNLNRFYDLAKSHAGIYSPDLQSFIQYLEILNDLGIEIEASEIDRSGVNLMTLHSTKGLEYDTVIITNMAQKRFPMERIYANPLLPSELSPEVKGSVDGLSKEELESFLKNYEQEHQLLEERRLAYVAFTRAKRRLILTYSKEYAQKKYYPSQFLNEISFRDNEDVYFASDFGEKYQEPEVELKTASEFGRILSSSDFEGALGEIVKKPERRVLGENEKKKVFSPSSLLTFKDCQKKFEYKYVYHMPDEKFVAWEAVLLGSFVHLVLEEGVKSGFDSCKKFLDYTRALKAQKDWDSVELEQAELLIKVFYERNKNKFNKDSKTEQRLPLELEGFKFIGFADRIDFHHDGLEIIDYKTGRTAVQPRHRNWQLGYYALAASKLGKVKKMTLDMLKQEKPLEFELDDLGKAKAVNSSRMEFDLEEVKEELVGTAREICECYDKGFKACPLEKNCDFCNEYVYRL